MTWTSNRGNLLGGPGVRNFLALPQNQNFIYFHFPDSWHDAAFVLSQPHLVSTQGVLGGLAVRVTFSVSLLCLLLILTFSQGLFSPSCSLFHVPLSAACDSDKVQEWLSKFPFLLTNYFYNPRGKILKVGTILIGHEISLRIFPLHAFGILHCLELGWLLSYRKTVTSEKLPRSEMWKMTSK